MFVYIFNLFMNLYSAGEGGGGELAGNSWSGFKAGSVEVF